MTVQVLILLLLISIIGFNVWNAINLRSLLKRPLRDNQLNDKNYWELKYKLQYIVTIFSVLLAIAAYLGYNTIENAKESITKDIASRVDSTRKKLVTINSQIENSQSYVDSSVKEADLKLKNYRDLFIKLSEKTDFVKKTISLSSNDLIEFKKQVNDINSKNIIQQNIYIVDNIQFTIPEITKFDSLNVPRRKRIYFSNLSTISGDKLPIFKKPPFILAFSNQGWDFLIPSVTPTYFDIEVNLLRDDDTQKTNLTVFITAKP
jgi:hypothetical protein